MGIEAAKPAGNKTQAEGVIKFPNTEHLRTGEKPIHIHMGMVPDLPEYSPGERGLRYLDGENVDWYAAEGLLDSMEQEHGGLGTFVFSTIGPENKKSIGYINCTGMFLVGKKTDGTRISLLSHQNGHRLMMDQNLKERFLYVLKNKVNEFKDIAQPGSIDCVLFGGNYFGNGDDVSIAHRKVLTSDYINSTQLIGRELQNMLGFEPRVLGPNRIPRSTADVYAETETGTLWFAGQKQNTHSNIVMFLPSQLEDVAKAWSAEIAEE